MTTTEAQRIQNLQQQNEEYRQYNLGIQSIACNYLKIIAYQYGKAMEADQRQNKFEAYVRYYAIQIMLEWYTRSWPQQQGIEKIPDCFNVNMPPRGQRPAEYIREMVDAQLNKLYLPMKVMTGELSSQKEEESDVDFACKALVPFKDTGNQECIKDWFDNIIGAQEAKSMLRDGFMNSLLYPNLFGKSGFGALIYGLPGTGKTSMAKALLNELQYYCSIQNVQNQQESCIKFFFFAPTTDMLKGKYVGETERKIKAMFNGASQIACDEERRLHKPISDDASVPVREDIGKGKQAASSSQTTGVVEKRSVVISKETVVRSILFMDEIDNLAPSRDKGKDEESSQAQITASAVNTLLQMMSGVNEKQNVIVVAATNYPQNLDKAFLRRFLYQIPMKLPNDEEKEDIIHLNISLFLEELDKEKSIIEKNQEICEKSKAIRSECEEKIAENIICIKHETNPRRWMQNPLARIIQNKLTVKDIKQIAYMCVNYSGADIEKMFSIMLKISGREALKQLRFLELKPPIPNPAGKKSIYYSINCMNRIIPRLEAGSSLKIIKERQDILKDERAIKLEGSRLDPNAIWYNVIYYKHLMFPAIEASDETFIRYDASHIDTMEPPSSFDMFLKYEIKVYNADATNELKVVSIYLRIQNVGGTFRNTFSHVYNNLYDWYYNIEKKIFQKPEEMLIKKAKEISNLGQRYFSWLYTIGDVNQVYVQVGNENDVAYLANITDKVGFSKLVTQKTMILDVVAVVPELNARIVTALAPILTATANPATVPKMKICFRKDVILRNRKDEHGVDVKDEHGVDVMIPADANVSGLFEENVAYTRAPCKGMFDTNVKFVNLDFSPWYFYQAQKETKISWNEKSWKGFKDYMAEGNK
jgi:SpoVK/Ycf46/Vps4 family AAA+-type ATPase